MSYRDAAKEALKRAKEALDNGSDHYLKYAALELRMALEALIYERAGLYTEELSNKALSTWQPGKLLNILLEIDPYTDKSATIFIGVEEEYGKPSKNMKPLGKERVLSLDEIKKFYDRLGSYLHTKTKEQIEKKKGASPEKIRAYCNELHEIINEVVNSPVFNFNMKTTSKRICEKCGTEIIRRIIPSKESFTANCIECGVSYKVTPQQNNEVLWEPIGTKVTCANKSCDSDLFLFESEIKVGTYWVCKKCNMRNHIGLALFLAPDENTKNQS